MAEASGPVRLLEVCGQRLSRFLHDAEHKHLVWLREVEEQGRRMLDSDFGAEPELMPKTPSQRRRPKKRRSSCLNDENKEPNRRRLSRRRSSSKPASSKPSFQRRRSKEQPRDPSCLGEGVSVADAAARPRASVTAQRLAEAQVPTVEGGCQGCPWGPDDGSDAAGERLPAGDAAAELHGVSSVTGIHDGQTAGEEASERGASTSTPKAARKGDPAMLQGDQPPQGLEKVLFQDSDTKITTATSKMRRCSGRRSFVGGPHKSHRASLAEKYSLASKRESMIRRSISRAVSKKAAARESSSASSRASCQSSLEVFVEEDVTSSMRPGLELNPPSEKTLEDVLVSSRSVQAASPPAQHLPPPEQQAGNKEGSCVNLNGETRDETQEQRCCAKPQEHPLRIWTRSYKQVMGVTWNGQQPGSRALSPLDDKHKNSANWTPPSSSPARTVVRPLKNFLQAVQRNQLLASPGPTGRVIKNFIKRNTSTRPDLKGDFVEKERQRLESLRKKQEAEEQRKKKVEEEKRRRQAEMKQKREERLRKALQARERVEQMEEEKKKRMEQRILQNDEKVRTSQGREEKVAEERSKKKLSKKHGEADVQKQKGPRLEKDEFEQQEPLQRRREGEVKEKGKVLELKNLLEQQQVEEVKERDHKQRGKEKTPQPQLESVLCAEKSIKEEESPKELHQLPGQETRAKQPESIAVASKPWLKVVKMSKPQQQLGEEKKIKQLKAWTAASGTWLSRTGKKSISTPYLGLPKAAEGSRSPEVDRNNYGMDLNSDDSTDDENEPRKPVPAWADGAQLNEAIVHQYYHPVNVDQIFGLIPSPKLEDIFGKSKPRYFKRTSSAVWHSPPGTKPACGPYCSFKN
ncbi:unnamed protein product [Bubo scandiacus]